MQAAERLVAARCRIIEQAEREFELARQGHVIVRDLQAGATNRQGAELQCVRLACEADHAKAVAAECHVLLERARHEVVLARQELAIVQRHRQNYLAAMRRVNELRSDEDAAEAWQVNHLDLLSTRLK